MVPDDSCLPRHLHLDLLRLPHLQSQLLRLYIQLRDVSDPASGRCDVDRLADGKSLSVAVGYDVELVVPARLQLLICEGVLRSLHGRDFLDLRAASGCKDGVVAFLNDPKVKGELNNFSNYIYQNLTIIKTSLPADYTHQDIFQYFDRFNTPSPNLENYEIVKFKLLEGLGKDQKLYTKLLEAAMNMDKCLIRKRTNKENNESINTRFSNAISFACDLDDPKHEFLTNYGDSTLNDVYLTNDEIKDNNDEETKDTVSSFSDFSELLNELLKNKTKGYESKEEEEKENNNFFSTPFFMLLTLYIMVFKPSENEV